MLTLRQRIYQEACEEAIRTGRFDVAALFLKKISDSSFKDSVLSNACSHQGDFKAAKWLLENGADINSERGFTPLQHACLRGHFDIVKLLIEKGAAVDFTISPIFGTPLMNAIERGYLNIVKYLVEEGKADVNYLSGGKNALMVAIARNRPEIAEYLSEKGAEIKFQDNGTGALIYAVRQNSEDLLKILIETRKVDLNAQDEFGWTPLSYALTRDNNKNLVKILLDNGANFEFNHLLLAFQKEGILETILTKSAERIVESVKETISSILSLPSNDCAPEDLECAGEVVDSSEI